MGSHPLARGFLHRLKNRSVPGDLRHAALQFLDRNEPNVLNAPRQDTMQTLRIMTCNVHSCIGMDGKLAPERIAHAFVDVGR